MMGIAISFNILLSHMTSHATTTAPITDEQLEDREMGKLMSENTYSMTWVDFVDVNRGDQPFLYMK